MEDQLLGAAGEILGLSAAIDLWIEPKFQRSGCFAGGRRVLPVLQRLFDEGREQRMGVQVDRSEDQGHRQEGAGRYSCNIRFLFHDGFSADTRLRRTSNSAGKNTRSILAALANSNVTRNKR